MNMRSYRRFQASGDMSVFSDDSSSDSDDSSSDSDASILSDDDSTDCSSDDENKELRNRYGLHAHPPPPTIKLMKNWVRVGCVVKIPFDSGLNPVPFWGHGVVTHINVVSNHLGMCTVRLLDQPVSADQPVSWRRCCNNIINAHVRDLTTVLPGKSGRHSWNFGPTGKVILAPTAAKALIVGKEADKEYQGKQCVVANIDENDAVVLMEGVGLEFFNLSDLCAMAAIDDLPSAAVDVAEAEGEVKEENKEENKEEEVTAVPLPSPLFDSPSEEEEEEEEEQNADQLQEQLSTVYADMIELLEDEPMGNIFDADTGLTKNGFVMDSTTCGQEDGAYHVCHDLDGDSNYCSIDEWNDCAPGWEELYDTYIKIQDQAEKMNITLDFE